MSDRTKLPAATREKIETALDKLIALLDALDPDPDLEESDPREPVGDDEPSLGATEALNHESAWRAAVAPGTDLEFDGDTCPDADKEPDADGEPWLAGCPMDGGQDLELDPADEEPSLGATHAVDQEQGWRAEGWFRGTDLEFDGETAPSADAEPSLGSRSDTQLDWAGGADNDREAEHDGREPDEDFEWDVAEDGIGDRDGVVEQFGFQGERCE